MTAIRVLPDAESLRADQRERRQRIVDAAATLMVDVDYENIQVRDVAERADVALGTLYRYFSSKEHLFACALLSWSQRFGERARADGASATRADGSGAEPSPAQRLRAVYRRAVRAFERQPRVYGVVFQVQISKDPHAAEVFRSFSRQQSAAFAQPLAGSRLADRTQADIVAVMSAVLNEGLRNHQLGLIGIEDVYRAIDRATRLLLPEPT